MNQKELVYKLKKELGSAVDTVTDESILKLTEGTFLRARVEFGIKLQEFIESIMTALHK